MRTEYLLPLKMHNLLKVECLMTIELIDSAAAAAASIKVRLKRERTWLFPQETVQPFIPDLWEREKVRAYRH